MAAQRFCPSCMRRRRVAWRRCSQVARREVSVDCAVVVQDGRVKVGDECLDLAGRRRGDEGRCRRSAPMRRGSSGRAPMSRRRGAVPADGRRDAAPARPSTSPDAAIAMPVVHIRSGLAKIVTAWLVAEAVEPERAPSLPAARCSSRPKRPGRLRCSHRADLRSTAPRSRRPSRRRRRARPSPRRRSAPASTVVPLLDEDEQAPTAPTTTNHPIRRVTTCRAYHEPSRLGEVRESVAGRRGVAGAGSNVRVVRAAPSAAERNAAAVAVQVLDDLAQQASSRATDVDAAVADAVQWMHTCDPCDR